ncbi:MAG TPA: hypothetical protein VIZ69_13575, partial [Thermoanaerobaculia bacterium]
PRRARLLCLLAAMTFLTVARLAAGSSEPLPMTREPEPAGSDVFVMDREGLLRDRPNKSGRFIGRLPGGSRLRLVEAGDEFLKVEILASDRPTGDPAAADRKPSGGYLAREVASVFAPGASGTGDLLAAGRSLASSESHRRYAAAFLLCAAERLRAQGGDPGVEVLLGETAEALAFSGGPFPPGLEVTSRPGPAGTASTWSYAGDAFRRGLSLTEKSEAEDLRRIRDRATAGVLRQRFPGGGPLSIPVLSGECDAWLELSRTATDPLALRASADRLGSSSLALGRLLVASGRSKELESLEARIAETAARVSSLLPEDRSSLKLLSRGQVLRAMRGTGAAPFPQEVRGRFGPKEMIVRIERRSDALELTVETKVGSTHTGPRKRAATPLLPVPGSLRLSPDGRSIAWLEIAGPSKVVPVLASLEKDEPAREIALLSTGRPLRDSGLAHVLSNLSGYSKDGQRLGVSVQAWNETPGPDARYSVVSVATGELVFETSKDVKSFERLIR